MVHQELVAHDRTFVFPLVFAKKYSLDRGNEHYDDRVPLDESS
jgi:hypothetical protein